MTNKVLHSRDDIDRLYVSRKGEGRELTTIEDCIDLSLQGLKECFKKGKERLFTTANNSSDNRRQKKTITKTRKQKWKEKQVWIFQETN